MILTKKIFKNRISKKFKRLLDKNDIKYFYIKDVMAIQNIILFHEYQNFCHLRFSSTMSILQISEWLLFIIKHVTKKIIIDGEFFITNDGKLYLNDEARTIYLSILLNKNN